MQGKKNICGSNQPVATDAISWAYDWIVGALVPP
jgi:hypothetical protein